ncbi:branched-chain amino acid transport system II carrier protein [Romboutsia ilealis]|uniref:Branched-chain amino acid transport system carrier protein n=1 Tax=Romboutsia faecis TaxID=2764597 RepID=A0ABR7JM37_9FIRM|nr:branched-chain amino acid transport system II carrier protein [Romboutsia faecis]MBC5995900.1 branched-chain amino acid transport system II carrier protein [Romboutsia faecis]MRN23100.1 branched-chain amino acid transport system II carrier protein [Romboutsia ilealis]
MKKNLDTLVVGFALFSMFFGAGNLLFPPYLGLVSGDNWLTSLGGFVLADVGLALLVLLAVVKGTGKLESVLIRGGKGLANVIGAAAVICIGPLLAIPRTAATTYEMGIQPMLNTSGSVIPVIVSVVFFGLTLVLTIKPSKVVDIVGKVLTPLLILSLIALIVLGVLNPIGEISSNVMIENNLFAEGVSQGYLTMDALAAGVFAGVIINAIINKGYNKTSEKVTLTIKAGLVAAIALALIYGGLTYLGATLSTKFGIDTPQALLMVEITSALLGNPGKILLCVIVSLACLTTAIGLTSATGEYFSNITNGKLKYETIVVLVCVFSAIVSNFGVGTIIKFSAPILEIVYPVLMALVLLSLTCSRVRNDNIFKCAAYVTLIVSLLTVANGLWKVAPFVEKLPLAPLGFNWILPAIGGAIIGSFIKDKKSSFLLKDKYGTE